MPHFASVLSALGLVLIAFSGCATPGPLHVYAVARATGELPIVDRLDQQRQEVPSFLEAGETVTGFGYDPFTDHFFLRLAPGDKIRVVDRPARKIKREFDVKGLGAGGDLAIRPRDGHVFFLEDKPVRVVETSRLGKIVRTFPLEKVPAGIGIACDLGQERLLVLHSDGRRVSVHDRDGRHLSAITLEQPVTASLAFDSKKREVYAPLAARRDALGVFDLDGKLVRQIEGMPAGFVDVGPRSFVRVF